MQCLYNHALVTGDMFIKTWRKIKKYKILPEKPLGYKKLPPKTSYRRKDKGRDGSDMKTRMKT